ncbi:hypothetical protein R6Q59_010006 [Mikania micrantha]
MQSAMNLDERHRIKETKSTIGKAQFSDDVQVKIGRILWWLLHSLHCSHDKQNAGHMPNPLSSRFLYSQFFQTNHRRTLLQWASPSTGSSICTVLHLRTNPSGSVHVHTINTSTIDPSTNTFNFETLILEDIHIPRPQTRGPEQDTAADLDHTMEGGDLTLRRLLSLRRFGFRDGGLGDGWLGAGD